MPKILVDPSGITAVRGIIAKQTTTIQNIKLSVRRINSSLDFEVAASRNIEQSLNSLYRCANNLEEKLEGLCSAVDQVILDFTRTDRYINTEAKKLDFQFNHIASSKATNGTIMPALALTAVNATTSLFGVDQVEYTAADGSLSCIGNFFSGEVEGDVSGYSLQKVEADESSKRSLIHTSITSESRNTEGDILGLETADGSFNGYVLKLTETEKAVVGAMTVTSTVGVTGLTVRGNASSAFDLFGNSTKTDTKSGGKVSVNQSQQDVALDEFDGTAKQKDKFTVVNASVAAEVGLTAAVLDYDTTIEVGDVEGVVDANVKLLDADAGVSAGISYGEDGLTVVAGAELGLSLAEVEGSASVDVGGVKAKATVSAEIGFGASFEVGFKDGEFQFEIGAALGIGGKIGFKIKIPDFW